MLALESLGDVELAPAHDDLVAVLQEVLKHLPEGHDLGLTVDQREHDGSERRLHLRVPVQPVQNDLRYGTPLQLDHDAHAIAIGLVAHVADVGQLLISNQLRDLLHQPGLVYHERELGDHDPFVVLVDGLDLGPRAHDDPASTRAVRVSDTLESANETARGEVRTLDELLELLLRQIGVVDQRNRGLHDLTQIVRRNVGGHADSDTRRAVDEQVRYARWQNRRLVLATIEVRPVVDGFFVDVRQELHRQMSEASLGIPVRRGGIAVDRTEVPLAVDERIAQREVLYHAHHRVVDGRVPVRVILTQHVADDGCALLVCASGAQADLTHGVQDAAMNRLETVPHIWQRALYDHAHRVVDERFAHLVLEQAR